MNNRHFKITLKRLYTFLIYFYLEKGNFCFMQYIIFTYQILKWRIYEDEGEKEFFYA